MAEIQRRSTSGDLADPTRRERRKSGIFFFNRSFKKTAEDAPLPGHQRRLKKSPPPLGGSATKPKKDLHTIQERPQPIRHVSLPLASNPPFTNLSSPDSSPRSSTSGSKVERDENDSTPTTPGVEAKDGFDLKRAGSTRSLVQTSAITVEAERTLSSSPKTASNSLGEAASIKEADQAVESPPTPPDTPGPSSTAAATENETAEEDAAVVEGAAPVEEPVVPEVQKISYHPDADLKVKLDGEEALHVVRSAVLETASPVWKDTISSQSTDATVDLTADPAFGLTTLFTIAHFQFSKLPQSLTSSQLHDLVRISHKYQTFPLLTPFLKPWLSTVDITASEEDQEQALVTASLLGHAAWVSQLLARVAHTTTLAADGTTLLTASGQPWSEQAVPAELVEQLASARLQAIERIIIAVSNPVNKLLNPDGETRFCHASADVEECEQLQLGSAIMGLTKARLWPAPEAGRVRVSAVELATTYGAVRMRRFQTSGLRFQEGEAGEDGHAKCGLGHVEEIEGILKEQKKVDGPLKDVLEARAKASGVWSEDMFA